jgi:hypothetical protein
MARELYHSRGSDFNEWHRSLDETYAACDLDLIEMCKVCNEPLCFMETCHDIGQKFKATTLTEKVAAYCNKPAFLIFYTPGVVQGSLTQLRVTRLLPRRSSEVLMEPLEFAKVLAYYHEQHLCEVPF